MLRYYKDFKDCTQDDQNIENNHQDNKHSMDSDKYNPTDLFDEGFQS